MAALELNFLGDLEVVRDGAAIELPPSRKTRALLAYLALKQRPFRREQLCELLWEIPDDPRGSLRWSLSKLRNVVDDAERPRIVADRVNVAFDASDVAIDVAALKALAAVKLDEIPTDALEEAARRYRGNFLEGLDLSNFHAFHSWCVAEREQASRAQTRVLGALTERLAKIDPERALPYARSLVGITPYDETARATLIRLLVATARADEAEQQYQLGARMLKEAGAEPTGALHRALHGAPGTARPIPGQGAAAASRTGSPTAAGCGTDRPGRRARAHRRSLRQRRRAAARDTSTHQRRARDRQEPAARSRRRPRPQRRRGVARGLRIRIRGDPSVCAVDRCAAQARSRRGSRHLRRRRSR
jgi:DNA-binding SARP family transcriptional activator